MLKGKLHIYTYIKYKTNNKLTNGKKIKTNTEKIRTMSVRETFYTKEKYKIKQ